MPELSRYPEYEKPRREIRDLRQSLAALLLEHHELEFHIRKKVEAEYVSAIGSLEHKALEFQYKTLRLKRKEELIRGRIDSQDVFALSQIEAQLIGEFNGQNEKLSESMSRMNAALERRFAGPVLSEGEEAELNLLYSGLIKKLHPDLNPVQNEKIEKLLSAAITAYKNAALDQLRDLSVQAEGYRELVDEPVGSMAKLEATKEKLLARVESLQKTVGDIKNSYPCNKKALLDDGEKLRERAGELIGQIREYRKNCDDLDRRVAELLGKSVWTK
jgi:hypothetical protein